MRTLRSINDIADERMNFEIIVIDGGSGAAFKEVANFSKSKNVIVLKEPDNGIYDGMNKGFELSNGAWVTYLNSGDTYNPNLKLDFLISELNNSNSIWAVGNAQIFVKEELRNWLPSQINSFRFQLGLNSFPHQATFYRKEAILTLMGQPFSQTDSVADWSLSYHLLLNQLPQYLEYFVSINQEAGNSSRIPLISWAWDITMTRRLAGKLITRNLMGDFLVQIVAGAFSRIKNRL